MAKLFIHDRRRRFLAATLAGGLIFLALTAWANAQMLPAAGDQGHLWFVKPAADGKTLTLFHRGPGDAANTIVAVETLHGQLRRSGIAAWRNQVWLMYVDGTVQRISAQPADTQTGWRFNSQHERALPSISDASLRAAAGSPRGPWVLIQARDPSVLTQVERPLASRPLGESSVTPAQARRNIALGLPPGLPMTGPAEKTQEPQEPQEPQETQETTAIQEATASQESTATQETTAPIQESTPAQESTATPSSPEATGPTESPQPETAQANEDHGKRPDHLLHLEAGRWAPMPLPDDWPNNAPAAVVLMGNDADRPVLLVQPPDATVGTLWVYRRSRDDKSQPWIKQTANLKGSGPLAAMVVEGQLVVCRGKLSATPTQVDVAVVRPERVIHVGTMSVATSRAQPWAAVPMNQTVAFVVRTASAAPNETGKSSVQGPQRKEGSESNAANRGTLTTAQGLNLSWACMNLSGKMVQPAAPLEPREVSPWADAAEYVVMLGVGVVALLLMLLFWQRDPQSNQLALPGDVVLADFTRRSIAGVIDLVPAVAFVMWFFGLGLGTLLEKHWPGAAGTFQAIIPGSVAILIFTVHTTLAECLTTRSLGKSVTGLRVTGMDGKRPRLWQLVLRGLLKIIDLVAWLLLILMFIGPFRQRLGDLIARTVVVMNKPEEDESEDDEDESP